MSNITKKGLDMWVDSHKEEILNNTKSFRDSLDPAKNTVFAKAKDKNEYAVFTFTNFMKNVLGKNKITTAADIVLIISQVNRLFNRDVQKYSRLYYRGEPKIYPQPKQPSFNRLQNSRDKPYELEQVRQFQQTGMGLEILDKGLADDHVYWWFLTQHHADSKKEEHIQTIIDANDPSMDAFTTILLDITLDPLIALYFACNKKSDDDGRVYILYNLGNTEIDTYETYGDYINDSQELYDTSRLITTPTEELSTLYDYVKRLVAQKGAFVICNPELNGSAIPLSWHVTIDAKSKKNILKELDQYFNINERTVFLI